MLITWLASTPIPISFPITIEAKYLFAIGSEPIFPVKIKNPIMIGHSFGGRISIIYAAKKGVEKLVLLASPFKRSVKKKIDYIILEFKQRKKAISFTSIEKSSKSR